MKESCYVVSFYSRYIHYNKRQILIFNELYFKLVLRYLRLKNVFMNGK